MHLLRKAVGLALLVALAGMLFALTPLGGALEEDVGLGGLFRLRGPRAPPPEVAIIALDREAAQVLGQPVRPAEWPRALHARLIDALSSAGARAVAFDLSFATPAHDPADDRALAAALSHANNVVLLDFLEQQAATDLLIERRLPPLPLLAESAAAHGPFPLPKTGRVHAWWLFAPGAGQAPTVPILVARIYDRASAAPDRFDADEEARYLDFYGPPRSVRTVGVDRVLAAARGGADGSAWLRETFAGRAVFVGFSAASAAEQDRTRDDYRTVFSRADGLDMSGVEIAATAFANLLEGRWPRPLPLGLQFAVFLGWGLLLGGLCMALRGTAAVVATLAAGAGYLALAHLRFAATAQWLPLTTPLLVQAPLALFGGVLWHYVDERRQRQRLGALITDLLPPVVVEHLLSRIRSMAPLERPMFGIFVMTDIQGFTSIAETMAPADTTRMLNDYFGLIFPAIEKHGGSVSEIDGDGMLAFWLQDGPAPQARRGACLAALEIAELTRRADALPGWPALPTRIGVHGGPITLARLGASHHHEYRAVGDAANTASRIEQLSKHLGTKLLVSEAVLAGIDDLLARPMGAFLLAGKATPVRVHELLAREADATAEQRRLCEAFGAALTAHAERRWDDAAAILQGFPGDGPSRFYLRQSQRHAAHSPAADWDGVVRMHTK